VDGVVGVGVGGKVEIVVEREERRSERGRGKYMVSV
jgi:hypothetical protein